MVVRLCFPIALTSCHTGCHKVSVPNHKGIMLFKRMLPVDIDILKPSTGYLSVERPSSSKGSPERQSSGDNTPSQAYAEPVSEGEEDESMDMVPAKDEGGRTGLSQQDAAAAIAFREKSLKERDDSGWQGVGSPARVGAEQDGAVEDEEPDESTPFLQAQRSPRAQPEPHYKTLSIDPLAPSSTFDQTLRERLQGAAANGERGVDTREAKGINEDELPEDDRLLVRDWIAPSGKKIAVPVRVEPKVYFANERTFLVSILHCGIGSTLSWTSSEMAAFCDTHRNHCHSPTQLCSSRRCKGTHQRRAVHARSTTCYRLCGLCLLVSCSSPPRPECRGPLLRQVWSDTPVPGSVLGHGDKYWNANIRVAVSRAEQPD